MKIQDLITGPVTYDRDGQYFWINDPRGLQMIAELRGWGHIQNMKEFKDTDGNIDMNAAGQFQDDVGQWIAEAINEKMQREAGSKPMARPQLIEINQSDPQEQLNIYEFNGQIQIANGKGMGADRINIDFNRLDALEVSLHNLDPNKGETLLIKVQPSDYVLKSNEVAIVVTVLEAYIEIMKGEMGPMNSLSKIDQENGKLVVAALREIIAKMKPL